MHPVLLSFRVAGTQVILHAYSTFYVLAWVAAVALGTVIAGRRGMCRWRAFLVYTAALLIGTAGARLLDVGMRWGYYAEDARRVYALGFRGFALYGGLLLALAAGLLLSRAVRLPVWRLADSAVPALAAGIILMRFGCFLNGCCFGTATSLPWGVTYPPGSPAWTLQLTTGQIGLFGGQNAVHAVHPTQLYEAVAALLLGALAVWLMHRQRAEDGRLTGHGVPFLAFLLGFTLFRFSNNFLRARLPSMTAPEWVYPALYLALAIGMAVALMRRTRGSESRARATLPDDEAQPTAEQGRAECSGTPPA